MTRTFDTRRPEGRERGVAMAASVARRGGLVVLPVENCYAVATDAFAPAAVTRLLAAKGRDRSTVVPVMVPDAATLDGVVRRPSPEMRDLVRAFWPGPLSIVVATAPGLPWDVGGRPGTATLRQPLHPVALEVLKRSGPLAVIAANVLGQDPPLSCGDAVAQLGTRVEVALDAGQRADDAPSSVVDLTGDVPLLVRVGAVETEALRRVLPDLAVAP